MPKAAPSSPRKNAGPSAPDRSLYRFRRENRLLSAAAFTRVFRQPRRSRDALFIVLSKPNDLSIARLGLAISKKNCRQATGRNRIKRVVRESFRLHQDALAGRDFVVMNQPKAANASNQALFDSLSNHWRRLLSENRRKTGKPGNDG